MLYRKIEKYIVNHLQSESNKILIVDGARQIGKSYIIREVGKKLFPNYIEVNMETDKLGDRTFADAKTMDDFYLALSTVAGDRMKDKNNTLVFIDEIQAYDHLLTLLKFLREDDKFTYIASGSLLGVTLKTTSSIPLGSIIIKHMYPLDFEEFLIANSVGQLLLDTIRKKYAARESMPEAIHNKLLDLFKKYLLVGGLPDAVNEFLATKNITNIRTIQNEILSNYAGDFSKHAPAQEVPRIDMVWQSILGQLSKENKKFVYGVLKKGGRAKEFELAIQWLVDAGLVYKITKVTKPELPLKFYEDLSAFKLYLCDCGLMGAMADTAAKDVLLGDNVFTEYKGAFTEQYVLQQLLASGINHIYYYSSDTSRMEMDFLVQCNGALLPIEVKGGTSIKATSLHNYLMEHPDISAIRYSMLPYRQQENITNMPLYGVLL